METPSQGLMECKSCGCAGAPHRAYRLLCDPCGKERQVEYQRRHREKLKRLAKPRTCKGCGKPFDTCKTGRVWRCPDCLAQYQREYAAKDRERHAEYSRDYRDRLGDEYRRRLVERRRSKIAAMSPGEHRAFRDAEAAKTKRLNARLKNDVFEAYGGWRCACCGEMERSFLSIDHMKNNGSALRRSGVHGHSGEFYRWLKKSGYPPDFQVLCMNCQFGKRMNGGTCPHQARCND